MREASMSDEKSYNVLTAEKGVPIKAWTKGVQLEEQARKQLLNVAQLPFIFKWVAAMPDVHWGVGATVGSVIPTDRKSTRLNSSHQIISYAVFCLKKKNNSSEHVQVLRAAQLVEVRRAGVYIYYRLADEQVFTLWQAMRQRGEARIAGIARIVHTY